MTIKSLILYGILVTIGLGGSESHAFGVIEPGGGIGGNCMKDTTFTFRIVGGEKERTTFAYSEPNCDNFCPCATCSQSERCICDMGYHSVDSYLSPDNWCTRTCTCEQNCPDGYYGDGKTCTQCPAVVGVYGSTTDYATRITDCYIPKNTALNDASGTFKFTSDCKYTN